LGSLSCAYFPRSLAGTIPWVAQSFELSRERSLTFVSRQADGGLESVVVVEGRVELADVTDAGARLRVRARVDAANDVEGEVQLRTCD
jgi:hypothetical protein